MNEATRTTLGYGVLGLALGMAVLPWLYIYATRYHIARTSDPTWVFIFLAIVLVPGLLFALVGRNKAARGPAA